VFVPLARPGLIIVDEEHDTSYKQEETPRYHGRDVAVMRGKFADALVVLGSATPSMESFHNAKQQRYELVSLTKRVFDRPLARVSVVNMREEFADEGPDVILSRRLRAAMRARLDRGEQSLVLLNRRGYAAAVFCRQCGHTMECPNCSVSLTVHTSRRNWRARCHYCNFAREVPRACVKCAAPYLEHVGFGTERVEAEIQALLPGVRVGRVDRDTIRKRGSLASLLNRFARRDLDVLVGTQMIAKGHDFPQVTLVGVISADVGLGLADFRAAERTFQLLTQVAGRAGRGEQAGEAVIQTLFPTHYSIRLATSQDYPAFFDKELDFREKMRYPPLIAMVNVVVRGTTFDRAMDAAASLARRVSERAAGGFVVLGPAPAPLTRLRGEHRAQFFLKGTSRRAMRQALRDALAELPDVARRAAVDVDPLSVL
jgi:primosomal protein N' (replication factor Y)